jgi:hypothetical protein
MTLASDSIGGRVVRYCLLPALLATALLPGALVAQGVPTYQAAQLACVRYEVRVHTAVTTDLQGRRREESLRRTGTLVVQGSASDSGLMLEAWWDTLRLWRRADGQTFEPETEGLLGGRYRGELRRDGVFLRTETPWIPDEVAEVSDVGTALDDLFPPLPAVAMRRGDRSEDPGANKFIRLADSARVARYRIISATSAEYPADSTRPFAVKESEQSDGILVWGTDGLLRWDRTVVAETRVEETAQRTFRSRVQQRIELQRTGSCERRER